jgi:hypothetical protein
MKALDLATLLSPSASPRAGGSSSLHSEAWHKAMEQEQLQGMLKGHSVRLGERLGDAGASHAPATTNAVNPVLRNTGGSLGSVGPDQAPPSPIVTATRTQNLPLVATGAEGGVAIGRPFIASAVGERMFPAFLQGAAEDEFNLLRCQAVLESLGRRLDRKWLDRNLHLEMEGDGVRLWVRDVTLDGDSTAAAALIQQLEAVLNAEGVAVSAVMVNGRKFV